MVDPAEIQRSNLVTSDALDRVTTLGLLGLLGGGGLRLAQGLPDLLGRRKPRPDPATADIPLPLPPVHKVADGLNRLGDAFGLYQSPAAGGQGPAPFLQGRLAKDPTGVPWFLPAAGLAAVGGGLGGYHLADYLLKAKQKGDVEDDVEDARSEFQHALSSGYRPAHKTASTGAKLGELLERLADAYGIPADPVKTADVGSALSPYVPEASIGGARDTINHYGGAMTGIYGTGLLTALLGGGYLGYQSGKKKNQDALVDKAVKQTVADRLATNPPEVYLQRGAA